MGSCIDLTEVDKEAVHDAFSALVSGGKSGYKTVSEKKKEVIRCENCSNVLSGGEKFCPECGSKVSKA